MSKREEAVEAMARAAKRVSYNPDLWTPAEIEYEMAKPLLPIERAKATAAFDAVIQFLADNAGPLSDAGWQAGKESFDKRLLRKGSKESFKAMLAAASA